MARPRTGLAGIAGSLPTRGSISRPICRDSRTPGTAGVVSGRHLRSPFPSTCWRSTAIRDRVQAVTRIPLFWTSGTRSPRHGMAGRVRDAASLLLRRMAVSVRLRMRSGRYAKLVSPRRGRRN